MTFLQPKGDLVGLSVVFASDEKYFPHLATAITSLLDTNREIVSQIFVLTQDSESPIFRQFLDGVFERYGIDIKICIIDSTALSGLYVSGHVSQAAYNRFLIGEILPIELQSVLYLDSDLIVVGDLSPLLGVIPKSKTRDSPVLWAVDRDDPHHLMEFGHSGKKYFNSGVLLVDLSEWRKRGVSKKLFEIGRKLFGQLHLWDQDVLNLVLEDSWTELPGEFNETALTRRSESALVVHFVGGTKPWMWGSNHPYRSEYDRFRSLTPYWPYRKAGLGRYLRKRFVPRGLQKPRKLVKRSVRLLRRKIGRLLGR